MVKDKLSELLELIKKDLELSEWSKRLKVKDQHSWFLDEVEELKAAMAKEDWENYKEELGDILWDLLKLILIAEKEGKLDAKETINQIMEKIKKRKPHLSLGKKLTAEEEEKQWYQIKAQSKKWKL